MIGPKVLVVDDDKDICEFVAWGLGDRGYEVLCAANGREALDILAKTCPDAIVLDMRMPIMNGYEFSKAYRETSGPHAPIVVMTAYVDPKDVAAEVGAQGYISKPFDLVKLSDILRQYISKS